jgi:hypothetical protein
MSCLAEITVHLKVALLPASMSRPIDATKKQINALLFRFNDELQGTPIAYSDICLPWGYGKILAEKPWLHIDVETKLLLFKPVANARVSGKIHMVRSLTNGPSPTLPFERCSS